LRRPLAPLPPPRSSLTPFHLSHPPPPLQRYVAAYLKWYLTDSVATQFEAFFRGFANVAGGPALDVFRPEELQLLVVGACSLLRLSSSWVVASLLCHRHVVAAGSQELDFDALEKAAEYEEPYHRGHRCGWNQECLRLYRHSMGPMALAPPSRSIIRELWEVVHSLSAEDKRRFLVRAS
jgi:hypothetical protein